jgi:hypothetical protein
LTSRRDAFFGVHSIDSFISADGRRVDGDDACDGDDDIHVHVHVHVVVVAYGGGDDDDDDDDASGETVGINIIREDARRPSGGGV